MIGSRRLQRPSRLWMAGSRALRWLPYALEFAILSALLAATQILSARLWLLPNGDVDEYYQYAVAFWTQRPIGHALPVEYPPLAILPFSMTLSPPGLPPNPHLMFALWMGALVLACYYGMVWLGGRRRALVYLGYLLLATPATLLARFDIVPALVTLVALWCAERRRFGEAYILLAVGVLLKLYPAFLIPIVAVEQWRAAQARAIAEGRDTAGAAAGWWHGGPREVVRNLWARPGTRAVLRGMALCLGLVLAGIVGAYILSPAGALSEFAYAGQRPLQVESTPASLLWLGSVVGIPARPDYSFTSLNFVGPLDVVLKPLSMLALAAGCVWVYWRQARGHLTVGQAFVACLGVVLVTNKIFSPQYLIWILPVVAYVEGFSLPWVAICLLTWLDFPIMYQWRHPISTVTYTPLFMPALAVRNGLLLWVTLRAIIAPGAARRRGLPAARGSGRGAIRTPEGESGRGGAEAALVP